MSRRPEPDAAITRHQPRTFRVDVDLDGRPSRRPSGCAVRRRRRLPSALHGSVGFLGGRTWQPAA
ncbi:MAG: hypothetical protein WAM30_16310 [Candidatus Dormiibacterota bacterium]